MGSHEERTSMVQAEFEDGNKPMHLAALYGHDECILALLDQVESEDRASVLRAAGGANGWEALHCAAQEGHS
eukprot:8864422-Prorocentrum_lima.AAC.1